MSSITLGLVKHAQLVKAQRKRKGNQTESIVLLSLPLFSAPIFHHMWHGFYLEDIQEGTASVGGQ